MYKAGFMQKQVWVKRNPEKQYKIDLDSFIKKLKRLTSGWSEASLSQLLNLFIKITEAKKEAARKRKDA
jgi:hypothetical protein